MVQEGVQKKWRVNIIAIPFVERERQFDLLRCPDKNLWSEIQNIFTLCISDNQYILFHRANKDILIIRYTKRLMNDLPLAEELDMKTFYSPGEKGYTDYPTYKA